jgi:cytochrome c biogenesis protein ResB
LEDSLKRFLFLIAVIAITGSLLAQDIQVNRQNKTISVTAD